jgi:murein DD-endopeptidase MepM/ murein hydrolase activator NlpD
VRAWLAATSIAVLLPAVGWPLDADPEPPPTPTSTVVPTVASIDATTTTTRTEPPTTTSEPTTTSGPPTTTTTTTEPSTTTEPPTTTEAPTTEPPTTTTDPPAAASPPPTTASPPPPTPPPPPAAAPAPRVPRTKRPAAVPAPPPVPPAPSDEMEWATAVDRGPMPSGRSLVPAGVTEVGQLRPITFPVAGPIRYSNDFGACRDGCRRQHKGNDLIGDRLQPLLAMHDGVVDRLLDHHPTAGNGVVIRDADGWEYHVYHVNNDHPGTYDGADDGTWRFAPGIAPGAPVVAGQVIAWMGDSGNSEGSVPHAHVEIHTPAGTAINPYWSLVWAQRDANCAVTESADAIPTAPVDDASPPGDWMSQTLSGGRPGSGVTAARMWIRPTGFTPIDAAALRVGDPRHDEDCADRSPAPSIPADLGPILATIRAVESGGDYTAQARGSSASGAYQFIDSSWAGYGGYSRAKDAPAPVQDAKAVELVRSILDRYAGDVSTVPLIWYLGHLPRGGELDRVPSVGRNTLTPRAYKARWLTRYQSMVGSPAEWVGGSGSWQTPAQDGPCRTVVVDVGVEGDPDLVLTQADRFATRAGAAAVLVDDPCDPYRRPSPATAPAETNDLLFSIRSGRR